jgi:hypothetical protein
VSNVTDMTRMFCGANSFSIKTCSSWDVSNVTDMNRYVFGESKIFSTKILKPWNVSCVTDYESHVLRCKTKMMDLGMVSSVTCMISMFHGASSFNQDIRSWDVSHGMDGEDIHV